MAREVRAQGPVTAADASNRHGGDPSLPGVQGDVLTDDRFRGLIEFRYGYWAHTGGEYRSALEAVDAILALLD